jgi:uncharacterized membrane protein YhhN
VNLLGLSCRKNSSFQHNHFSGGLPLVCALAFGAVGDFALSRPGERAFLIGMVAFAVAHLAYIVLIGAAGFAPGPVWIAVFVVLAASTEVWLRPRTGGLKWPVRGYVVVIAAMGLAAAGMPPGYALVKWGAALFILSDLVLSIGTFVLPQESRWQVVAGKTVWITYIAAQACLFLGLV